MITEATEVIVTAIHALSMDIFFGTITISVCILAHAWTTQRGQ